MASCLDGFTRDENFLSMVCGKHGSGGNGKSLLSRYFLKTLGEYGCIAPVIYRQRVLITQIVR
jgi:hypothetical protein